MKAFRPNGSRWFARTAAEVMDEWLEHPELIGWLSRTVELRALCHHQRSQWRCPWCALEQASEGRWGELIREQLLQEIAEQARGKAPN